MTTTPGPWEAVNGTGAGWSVRKQHVRPGYEGLAPICSMAWFQFAIPGIIDDEISEANCRLIAASPDLLAAAKELIAAYESMQYRGMATLQVNRFDALKAAIAKAETT
jgi:hypothetical protein